MPPQEYLTKKEVEAQLRLHRNTVGRLLASGRFPNAFRAGRHWRIPAGDLEVFIRTCRYSHLREEGRP